MENARLQTVFLKLEGAFLKINIKNLKYLAIPIANLLYQNRITMQRCCHRNSCAREVVCRKHQTVAPMVIAAPLVCLLTSMHQGKSGYIRNGNCPGHRLYMTHKII